MKTTNNSDRVKLMNDLDALCSPARKMLYAPEFQLDNIDAVLKHEASGNVCGIAKVFSSQGNYGSKPFVELDKNRVDFLRELANLMGQNAAVIVRFRNKSMYWRIDRMLNADQKMLRGKPHNYYKLPINLLKNV